MEGYRILSKIIKTREFSIFLILVSFSVIIGLINPAFFSISTLFDTLRTSIVYFILAFGFLPVMISNGIDISFVAIAALTSYSTHTLLINRGYQGGILLYYIIACGMGLLAGLLNGFLVTRLKLPIFNNSLGVYVMWYGFNLFFIGDFLNFNLPKGTVGYYGRFIVTVQDPLVGTTGLHISIIYVVLIGLFMWWLLKYTIIGRGIYAMGGNREVAVRSGFNTTLITLISFAIMGILSAVAGVTQSFLCRYFNPILFRGEELDILAALIVGGVSVTGGHGSVLGAVLGVLLIQLIQRALILTGIPAPWHRLTVGILLIIFTSIPALAERRAKRISRV